MYFILFVRLIGGKGSFLVMDNAVGFGINAGHKGRVDRVGQGWIDFMDVSCDGGILQPPRTIRKRFQKIQIAGLKRVQRDDNKFMFHFSFSCHKGTAAFLA